MRMARTLDGSILFGPCTILQSRNDDAKVYGGRRSQSRSCRSCRRASAPSTAIPRGYGGYGWGGWGSTIQGSTAAGPGLFQHGPRAYNEDTAVARSINNDTYHALESVHVSLAAACQQPVPSAFHRRAHASRSGTGRDPGSAAEPPRDRDITDGDALNVLVDELSNPAGRACHWGRSRRRSRPS